MLLRLLKNDLKNGFLTNLMMTLFIAVSTMLACASISLIYSSQNQISYFMDDLGKVADYNFSMMNVSDQDVENVIAFMKNKKIENYQIERDIALPLEIMRFNGKSDLESSGCFATTLPSEYNLLFDEDGHIPKIGVGEVGIPLTMKQQLHLKLGDQFEIQRGNHRSVYTITSFVRDSLYGSDMMGQKRIILHPDDFKKQQSFVSEREHSIVVSVMEGTNTHKLEYDMQQSGLPNAILVDKATAKLSFMGVSLGTSALLLGSGLILLCMAFLIIRFTILFQIENNYAEIGIMKAIGFNHRQIKPIYLVKYMGIAILGTLCGFFCSIPLADVLEKLQSGVVPAMPKETGILLSFLAVFAILAMVYVVTTMVLRKLKKQSTMDAIRKGNEGETYEEHTRFTLAKSKIRSLTGFLAINDLMAHRKQFLMMVIIYALCMVLILVPSTLKDAFQKDAFLQILKISSGDLYTQQISSIHVAELEEKQATLQQDLRTYDDKVRVEMETMTSASLSSDGLNTSVFLMHRKDMDSIDFDEGMTPVLSNELALSTTMAERYGKTVGDSITMSYEGKKQEYLISGIYGSMMNLGNNILAGDIPHTYAYTGYLVIHLSGNEKTRSETAKNIMQTYDKMKLIDGSDMVRSFSGDMPAQIATMANLIIAVMLFILFALTILFSKLHMLRSKKAIALMRSLGYGKKQIRHWLLARCVIQIILALVVGILLHVVVANGLLEAYMESMGMGSVELQCDPFNMLVWYPIAYLCVSIAAQVLVNGTIPAWDIKDMSEE